MTSLLILKRKRDSLNNQEKRKKKGEKNKMAIDFGKTTTDTNTVISATPETKNELEVVESYDIVNDRKNMEAELIGSAEVDALVSTIVIDDMNTIVAFGSEAADEISKVSDTVLNSMSMDALDETSKMMDALSNIMSKFDLDEIQSEPKGLQKLFTNARKQMDKILNKYHTMGEEVDKIYIELKKYEDEIKDSNRLLVSMFDTNVDTYHKLVKYILAGEQACKEIEDYIAQKQAEYETSGNNEIQFELASLNQALMMMEQRTQDLRTAESVAMQSIPMLKTMEFGNMNLVRKINSAFIITLPVFKQALAQAMLLKRQSIQAESMSKLDEKTNELLIKNAQNSVEQSKRITAMASTSSIKAETLETTWHTIMNGIEETKKIQSDSRAKRIEDQKKLEDIKKEFKEKYAMPSSK